MPNKADYPTTTIKRSPSLKKALQDRLKTQAALQSQSKFHLISNDIASLVCIKQKAYGDSFGKSGKIMEILYPNGISLPQLNDALTIVRIIDKLFRVATHKTALGESPYRDIIGYALLATARDASTMASKPSRRRYIKRLGTKRG